MSTLSDAVGAGLKAARAGFHEHADRPAGERFAAGGHPVICPHCHGDRCDARQTLLNTTMLAAIGLDWLDRSATALVRVSCTHIVFFAARPDVLP